MIARAGNTPTDASETMVAMHTADAPGTATGGCRARCPAARRSTGLLTWEPTTLL